MYNPNPSTYGTNGIVLNSGADNNVIKNNVCSGAGDCIHVASNSNQIIGNQVTGNFTRGINVLGNSNKVQNNNIVGTCIFVVGIALSGNTNQVIDNIISATNMWGVAISNTGTGNTFPEAIDSSTGNVGIGTSTPHALLDVASSSIILETSSTPTLSTSTCVTGQIQWDASYIYVCTASNNWKRATLNSF